MHLTATGPASTDRTMLRPVPKHPPFPLRVGYLELNLALPGRIPRATRGRQDATQDMGAQHKVAHESIATSGQNPSR